MNNFDPNSMFIGATKHLYNWLYPSVSWLVSWLVGQLVGWSIGNALLLQQIWLVLGLLFVPKCLVSLSDHFPCPPACNFVIAMYTALFLTPYYSTPTINKAVYTPLTSDGLVGME